MQPIDPTDRAGSETPSFVLRPGYWSLPNEDQAAVSGYADGLTKDVPEALHEAVIAAHGLDSTIENAELRESVRRKDEKIARLEAHVASLRLTSAREPRFGFPPSHFGIEKDIGIGALIGSIERDSKKTAALAESLRRDSTAFRSIVDRQ